MWWRVHEGVLVGLFRTDTAAEEENIREGSTRVEQHSCWKVGASAEEHWGRLWPFSSDFDWELPCTRHHPATHLLTWENRGGAGSNVAEVNKCLRQASTEMGEAGRVRVFHEVNEHWCNDLFIYYIGVFSFLTYTPQFQFRFLMWPLAKMNVPPSRLRGSWYWLLLFWLKAISVKPDILVGARSQASKRRCRHYHTYRAHETFSFHFAKIEIVSGTRSKTPFLAFCSVSQRMHTSLSHSHSLRTHTTKTTPVMGSDLNIIKHQFKIQILSKTFIE